MDANEYIRICNRITQEELVMMLMHDASWRLPAMCFCATTRMAAARKVVADMVVTFDGKFPANETAAHSSAA